LCNESFWSGETEDQSRKRRKFFDKASSAEQEYRERSMKISRQLKNAQTRLAAKRAELRRANYKVMKAKAGFI
jgi:hypothetical protein